MDDGLRSYYTSMADDASLADIVREAAIFLIAAEKHVEAEEIGEALQAATESVARFRKLGGAHSGHAADALRLVIHVFRFQGKLKFANRVAREELAIFQGAGDAQGAAKMRLSIAEVNMDKRGSDNRRFALECATQALAAFQQCGDGKMEAAALLVLTRIYLKSKGDYKCMSQKAQDASQAALLLYTELGDRRGMAKALHNLGAACIQGLAYKEALEASRRAASLFNKLGDKAREALELQSMAHWCLLTPAPELALTWAEEALSILRRCHGEPMAEASALNTVVRALAASGQARQALNVARLGLRRFRGVLGHRLAEAHALETLAFAYSVCGDAAGALRAAEEALLAFRDLRERAMEGTMARTASELRLRMQRGPGEALQGARGAQALSQGLPDPRERARPYLHLAEVHLADGALELALEAARDGRELFRMAGCERGEAASLMTLCSVYIGQRDYGQAVSAAAQACQMLHDLGEGREEVAALGMLAKAQIEHGDTGAAIESSGRALELHCGERDGQGQAAYLLLGAEARLKGILSPDFERHSFEFEWAKDEALAMATRAVALVREAHGVEELLASGLTTVARIELLDEDGREAANHASEAARLYRKMGNPQHEASALEISAVALASLEEHADAVRGLERAFELRSEAGDGHGKPHAIVLLDRARGLAGPQDEHAAAAMETQ